MLNTTLKTTSVLALCTALATPPGLAQSNGGGKTADLPLCELAGPFPCVLEDGTRIKNARQFAKKQAGEAIEALTGEDDAASADQDTAAEGAADDAQPTEDQAAEEPSSEAQAAEEPVAEEQASEEPVAEEPVAEEPVVEEQPAEEPVAEDDAATVDAPVEEPMPEAEPAEDPVEQPAADAAPTGDTETEPAPETEAESATDTEAQAEAPAQEESAAPRKRKDKPAAAAAADVSDEEALAEVEAGEDEDVTVETVTEETSRSSDEDFATAAGAAGATAEANARNNGGNDDFAKALAIGLGALAVGAILANGARVVSNSGDRVVVENTDGELQVLKNDDEILRRPGAEVRTRTFDDGSTRTVVTRENGVRIITIRAADGTALKRVRVMPDGSRYVLFDDTETAAPVEEAPAQPAAETIEADNADALREALIASMAERSGRRYALAQVRDYPSVRDLAPQIEVRAITFPTNSAAIPPQQAERLADLGLAIADVIAEVPDAVFLVEGHTDAIGSEGYNLALSDRRSESVALALAEYFDVPPENLVTQGYGESDLKVDTQEANRQNRRVVVRNITPLLR